ncbi:2TM domain-containing protein [Elizabethkingia sp. JS20170427COW]|uniref:2TM domain-containing protein n=1 Tax=Elizabethkingia sp. JS20170427COW TaxID=2583851 RepID=UPI0011109E04|nr:2TM domain-containing protein [Elizabethkingia sp. JS20170427COW]QCX53181.1 2TM domain-containing protein [Elizabethkingia sp. JS20170427COW]
METYHTEKSEDLRYQLAIKQVKKEKSFYIHAIVYFFVNLMIIVSNVIFGKTQWASMENYYTAIFWGFGLGVHGLSVFLPNFILGKEWETRKIEKLMKEYKDMEG